MKVNESRTFNTDGKRGKPLYILFVVSLIVAFVFAALSMGSVSAAPVGPGEDAWDKKVNNLQAEIAILNTLVTQPGKFGNSEEQVRYRDKYIATMRAAQALLVSGGNVIPVTGSTDDGDTGNAGNGRGSYYQRHPEKLMALYLHQLRKLRKKMGVTSKENVVNNGNNGDTGTGTTTPTPTRK